MGKETQQNFMDIDFNQVHCKTQEIRLDNFLLLRWIVSPLSNELAWVHNLSKWGRHLTYLYTSTKKSNNPTWWTYPQFHVLLALWDSKIHFNNTFVGTTDPNYNRGFKSRLYMTSYINDIPNRRNNISERGNNNNNTK